MAVMKRHDGVLAPAAGPNGSAAEPANAVAQATGAARPSGTHPDELADLTQLVDPGAVDHLSDLDAGPLVDVAAADLAGSRQPGAPAKPSIVAALRGPGMLAVAGMVVNGGSLVMNLVLARVLDATAYGALAIQISIFMILSMIGSAVQMAVVHRDTATEHGDSRRERWTWVRRLRSAVALGVVVTGAVGLVICRPLASLLSYPHPISIAAAILGGAVWVSLSIERGLLQARGAYEALARNLAFESCVRIGLVVALVVAGLGVNGAGLGLVLGLLVGTEHARWASGRAPHRLVESTSPVSRPQAKGTFADFPYDPDRLTTSTGPIPVLTVMRTRPGLRTNTLTALGALVPLSLLQNMDVVIVGALNPSGAGTYAAMSTVCKVPVFIGLAVANFLLPEAARRLREGVPARGALTMAVLFVVAPGLVLSAASLVAGDQLMSLVFPPELVEDVASLWVLSLAMTYLAVTLMFTTYLLGAGERFVVAVLSAGTVLTVLGLVAAGGGLSRTSAAGLACQALNASLVGIVVLLLHRRVARTGGEPDVVDADARRPGQTGYPADLRPGRLPRDDDALTASA